MRQYINSIGDKQGRKIAHPIAVEGNRPTRSELLQRLCTYFQIAQSNQLQTRSGFAASNAWNSFFGASRAVSKT